VINKIDDYYICMCNIGITYTLTVFDLIVGL